ncbi:hypothetical protein AAG570_008111 [Ranatra chinensis]|uniref:LRRCT domain-containing protein n=1 Tax=Ranatra chinensis TaxID=642074 RepID=A0ABD0Y722_9HEMI
MALPAIAAALARLQSVTLLDLNIQKLTSIDKPVLEGVVLQGLVISSGELARVGDDSFVAVAGSLEALGLPDNKMVEVPTRPLTRLPLLNRLDLSHNYLQTLKRESFMGLTMLTFLDLSANQIKSIDSLTFSYLPHLKVLKIQSNSLTVETISKLQGLFNLEELDLSVNSISGPLRPGILPKLPRLKSLDLAHNHLSSIMKGALQGLDSLISLSLQHNMIDVIEDHAFSGLLKLDTLSLAHNRMVAVSEASLAHLNGLIQLDVSHNFLRALTKDLVSHLYNLEELTLDDNDISMVSSDALDSANHLNHLKLANNPLNCDCSLIAFAKWLHNSHIPKKDKMTAVCATPPSLENGLVQELLVDEPICEQGKNHVMKESKDPMSISRKRVTLRAFNYDDDKISLLWTINMLVNRYYCDALLVYEVLGEHEVLLETERLWCDSGTLKDPHVLPVSVEGLHLRKDHRYRYCLIMIEKHSTDESALIMGCSDVLTLSNKLSVHILSLDAEFANPEILSINAQIWPKHQDCSLEYKIYGLSEVYEHKPINCSTPKIEINGVKNSVPYKVCAFIIGSTSHCIRTQFNEKRNTCLRPSFSFVFISLIIFILVTISVISYRLLKKTCKQRNLHEQCSFLPTIQNETQHSRYVKLQATTKV